jgi:TonB family protein
MTKTLPMNRSMALSSSRRAVLCRFLFVTALLCIAPAGRPLAQQAAPAAQPATTPAVSEATATNATSAPAQATTTRLPAASDAQAGGITEEQLKPLLLGKSLYLRNCYLDNSLSFNEHGAVIGHPAPGAFTLCGVEFNKVKLTKHKVELYGDRFALHFLGALPYEDPTKAFDRVRITNKKKILKIAIDREVVVKPKKVKVKKPGKNAAPKSATLTAGAPVAQSTAETSPNKDKDDDKDDSSEPSEADQLKASIAAAPQAEKPADPSSVTTTTSPAHSAQVLRDALDKIFAPGLDDRMMAAMPDFWKLYYQAAAAKSDYRPSDPSVLRQNTVDKKARLLTSFEPASNEFAQANGVAGMALYHVVIGPDGKPGEIAVARPIGFGLDENAVESIRNARFEPAVKGGKPVPVLLDLVVQFRIFSDRTAVKNALPAADKSPSPQPVTSATPSTPVLPGPYSRQQN